jgi:hypothetical protein
MSVHVKVTGAAQATREVIGEIERVGERKMRAAIDGVADAARGAWNQATGRSLPSATHSAMKSAVVSTADYAEYIHDRGVPRWERLVVRPGMQAARELPDQIVKAVR